MKKTKKILIALMSFCLIFSTLGPHLVSATEKETVGPRNNSPLSDKELLDLEISQMINSEKVLRNVNTVNSNMSEDVAEELVQDINDLSEENYLIDEETLAYIDSINPDIDVQELIDQELLLNNELNSNEAEALIAPWVIKGAIAATGALLRKAGIQTLKVSFHLGKRMIQRGIDPIEVYNAITKGKKYYDPKYKSTVYHYKGIAVAKKGGTLTTTYKSSKPKSRWKRR